MSKPVSTKSRISMSPLMLAVVAAGALGLAGCDVKKTQEGKYEVTPPDVTVGKKKEEISVPKTVQTEKKTIDVPTLGVKTAKEKEQEKSQKQMGASGSSSSSQ